MQVNLVSPSVRTLTCMIMYMPSCKNVPLISCVNITEHCSTLLLYLFLKFVLALGSRRVQTGAERVGQQWMLFEISDQEKKFF